MGETHTHDGFGVSHCRRACPYRKSGYGKRQLPRSSCVNKAGSGKNEEGMAVRRELTSEDYLAIVRRRRWLIIIPAILGVTCGCILSLLLPKKYTSHTMILVEQPTVPDSYVKPVVSED